MDSEQDQNKKILQLTLTENELDIITNSLCFYAIHFLNNKKMFKFSKKASKCYDKICNLIPKDWNWSGD
jgi:hypothetical protein